MYLSFISLDFIYFTFLFASVKYPIYFLIIICPTVRMAVDSSPKRYVTSIGLLMLFSPRCLAVSYATKSDIVEKKIVIYHHNFVSLVDFCRINVGLYRGH